MGDAESVQAGEYKITWKPVKSSRIDTAALKGPARCGPGVHPGRPPPAASAWHEKAPCITHQDDCKRPSTNHKGR